MKGRILIVDDNVELAEVFCRFLKSVGYEAQLFHFGKLTTDSEILDQMVNHDAVILDLNLGGHFDGIKLLKALREISNVPVLIVSGKGRTPEVVDGLNKGADDYLPKPIHMDELHARLKAVLRRRELDAGISPKIEAGFFPMLSPFEKTAYRLLLSKKGEVVTRDELCRALGKVHSGRAIDTLISRLRNKLRNAAFNVESIHGKGYFLSEDRQPSNDSI